MAPAPAKINRFLHITGRRTDGYHTLETGFQFVDLCDWIHVRPTTTGRIQLLDDPLGLGETNLVSRAAHLLQPSADFGVDLFVEKHIPSGAGLGGGSSDAATTLVLLNALWRLKHTKETLMEKALMLGADVPVFIYGSSCFASGIGEQCEPEQWPGARVLLASPNIFVSTEAIFQHPKLTRDTPSCRIRASQLDTTRNDCETVVRETHPEIDRLMALLVPFGKPRLTGTGSTCFVIDPVDASSGTMDQVTQVAKVTLTCLRNRSMLYTARANA